MAGAVEESNRLKVFICWSQSSDADRKLAQELTVILRGNRFKLDVACPGTTEEWGDSTHDSAITGLKDFTAAVVIASKVLFERYSSGTNAAAKRMLDALFDTDRKVLMLRRNMTEKDLKDASPMGYTKSLDADSMSTESVAKEIYARIAKAEEQVQYHLRDEFGERQQPDVVLEARTPREYRYDVFICFSSTIEKWVKEDLIPELEDSTVGLKVCVHYRDFRPGRTIINNIIDSIQNSKKIVFVISDGFSASGWCEFEMHAAITFILKTASGRKMEDIIPILYTEGVPVPSALRPYTSINKYDKEFWSIMKTTLRK
jgi:hypothetical protein